MTERGLEVIFNKDSAEVRLNKETILKTKKIGKLHYIYEGKRKEDELLNWKLTQNIVTDETKEVSIPIATEEELHFLGNQNRKKDDLNINQQIENEEGNEEIVNEVDISRKTKSGRTIRNPTWLKDYELLTFDISLLET
ncbi:hypothetical protein QE152_g34987 [Popillia japonica]|uniref:Uncharacterized protein n=1 Tax=Popillia japonica TaxID=7064 RepID=A0AAW1ISV1_POPJA